MLKKQYLIATGTVIAVTVLSGFAFSRKDVEAKSWQVEELANKISELNQGTLELCSLNDTLIERKSKGDPYFSQDNCDYFKGEYRIYEAKILESQTERRLYKNVESAKLLNTQTSKIVMRNLDYYKKQMNLEKNR